MSVYYAYHMSWLWKLLGSGSEQATEAVDNWSITQTGNRHLNPTPVRAKPFAMQLTCSQGVQQGARVRRPA